jgi:hypothetical protein
MKFSAVVEPKTPIEVARVRKRRLEITQASFTIGALKHRLE